MGLRIDHHIYIHQDGDFETIKLLNKILGLNNQIIQDMAKNKAEWQALATEFRQIFLNIANDITRLTDQLQRTDLTEAEEEEIYTEFRALADEAKAIADRTTDPDPEPIP